MDSSALRNEIFRLLVNKDSIDMDIVPFNPIVRNLVRQTVNIQYGYTRVDLMKYLFWLILRSKRYLTVEDFRPNVTDLKISHSRPGITVNLHLDFKFIPECGIHVARLIMRGRSVNIQIDNSQIPTVLSFKQDETTRFEFISRIFTAINNEFGTYILNKLDLGLSVIPSRSSSQRSSGASTPGCVFLD